MLNQLQTKIEEIEYYDAAKLQIKTRLDSNNLDLEKYFPTPVICFDLSNDIKKAKDKYFGYPIFSIREIYPDLEIEIEQYFKILGAYAIGIIDHINITDIDVITDNTLNELFIRPIPNIIRENNFDIQSIIKVAKQKQKPKIVLQT